MENDNSRAEGPARPLDLLWPGSGGESRKRAFTLDENVVRDLELERLFMRIAGDQRRYLEIEPILRQLNADCEAINYRQDILEDLIRHPGLASGLEAILPFLESIRQNRRVIEDKDLELYRVTCRMTELESLISC